MSKPEIQRTSINTTKHLLELLLSPEKTPAVYAVHWNTLDKPSATIDEWMEAPTKTGVVLSDSLLESDDVVNKAASALNVRSSIQVENSDGTFGNLSVDVTIKRHTDGRFSELAHRELVGLVDSVIVMRDGEVVEIIDYDQPFNMGALLDEVHDKLNSTPATLDEAKQVVERLSVSDRMVLGFKLKDMSHRDPIY